MGESARLIAGISGASGVVYGLRLLTMAKKLGIETHLVMTPNAEVTLVRETSYQVRDVQTMADACYQVHDMTAPLASGAFRTMGMVVAPCSIRSLSEIATGVTSNLLTRAADVTLKERRRLVLMVRESPLHGGHLRAMLRVSEMGGILAPPVPAFYIRPQSLDELVDYAVGRVLDMFCVNTCLPRWGENI